MRRWYGFFALGATLLAMTAPASAWGSKGHEMIGGAAIATLPASVPPFVLTNDARQLITYLGPEADRVKISGRTFDADESPAHYVDADDAGKVGSVSLRELPPSRNAYDTELRASHLDEYQAGYLPYALLGGWNQVVSDFAYWRVDVVGATRAHDSADRAWFDANRKVREMLTLRDIGYWGHFVADASQPLHVSIHFNGWGDSPNPAGYSNDRTIHARFESDFVNRTVTSDAVIARVRPFVPCGCTAEAYVARYLMISNSEVADVYRLEGRDAFTHPTPESIAFGTTALANGAAAMRDLIAEAWIASATRKVGYPSVSVSDIEAGRALLSRSSLGE